MFEKNEKNLMAMLSDDELEDVSGGTSTAYFFKCDVCGEKVPKAKWSAHMATHK